MAKIRVLIVDDSAYARKVLRECVETDPGFEVVGIARDGLEALEQIAQLRPDVLTLDLVMPNLDGLDVLRAMQSMEGRLPRVIVVSSSDAESALGLGALEGGATDAVHKPTAQASALLYELGDELRAKLRAGASARGPGGRRAPRAAAEPGPIGSCRRLLLVGASTGGPAALSRLLQELPASFPVPIVAVVHLPEGYTAAFARRLDEDCSLQVVEASDQLVLRPGMVAIARAGFHACLASVGRELRLRLQLFPVTTFRPSVDVLFQSAEALGEEVLAVVLTGMGRDGTEGARSLRSVGADVLTESESSCVVYGMPRCVREAGLSSAEAPIEEMVPLVLRYLGR